MKFKFKLSIPFFLHLENYLKRLGTDFKDHNAS